MPLRSLDRTKTPCPDLGSVSQAKRIVLLAFLPILLSLPWVAAAQEGRIYVRRIEFQGSESVQDYVLRREISQLEGTFLNTVALEQSRRRLEQLFYVDSAVIQLRPVEGTADVVDAVITIVDAPSRRYGGGGAYSESQGASMHAYFIDENVAGSGQRFSFMIDGSDLRGLLEVAHTDPYARRSGVSRTVALSTRSVDRLTRHASSLYAELASASIEYGVARRALDRAAAR
jgi:outer membrane protein insertion porin family